MNDQKLTGVLPALVTPFDDKANVNPSAIEKLVAYFLSKKVDGFYVCGSTGQGLWMSTEERKLVANTVIDAVAGAVPVIVHVGCVAPAEAAKLTVHASGAGAAGISSIIPPSYEDLDALHAYFSMLSAHAPDLPLLPYFMGSTIPPIEVMAKLADVPTVAGTKYTGPNMFEMTRIIEMGTASWSVFSGMDEQCVFGAMCGADGAIGSSVNVIPGVYREIRRLVADNKQREAYTFQKKANRVITVLKSYGYAGALKAALGMLGIECGDPKLPAPPFDRARTEQIKSDLSAVDFEELSSM